MAVTTTAAPTASDTSLRGTAAVNSTMDEDSCCGGVREYLRRGSIKDALGPTALAIGNERGTCCMIEAGLARDKIIRIFSASKMLTSYVILRLVQDGRLRLETRAAEVLGWWNATGGGCHNVTVFHLLGQTGSLIQYHSGLGLSLAGTDRQPQRVRQYSCSADDTLGCAKEAYRSACSARPLGSKFEYAGTNFHVLGAIALAVTGLPTYNDVFRKYLAEPLRMSRGCIFDRPSLAKANPGGGGRCTAADFALFLRAALADEIVPVALRRQAEKPHTLLLGVPSETFWDPWHYGLGQWRECPGPEVHDNCSDTDAMGVKVSSMGTAGYYPWILRRGKQSHWGVIARKGRGLFPMTVSFRAGAAIEPMAAAAVEALDLPPAALAPAAQAQRAEQGVLLALCLSAAALCCLTMTGLWRCCAKRRKRPMEAERYVPVGIGGGVAVRTIGREQPEKGS